MKIGIIYDDVARAGLDCSRPDCGNPGIGGTEYCFLMLIYYLRKCFQSQYIAVYRYQNLEYAAKMPCEATIQYICCSSIQECVEDASKRDIGILVFSHKHSIRMVPLLQKNKISGVAWIHNWVRGPLLDAIANEPMIKRAVFLGAEHYDRYMDHRVIQKAAVLPNMFCSDDYPIRYNSIGHRVTYTGAIVPEKGFDQLAYVWKDIVNRVPNAELFVLGKGNLYGDKTEMGSYGVAEKGYESKFIRYLADEQGKLLPSVHFMGIVGSEKNEIYRNTKVGVVNPSGVTEVCPVSALEMEAAGVPIVSRYNNGLPDVVINHSTGILIRQKKKLADAIVKLLCQDGLNEKYGLAARTYIKQNFDPNVIIRQWYAMFEEIDKGRLPSYQKPRGNYLNNLKWLRMLSRLVAIVFKKKTAVIDLEAKLSDFLKKVR